MDESPLPLGEHYPFVRASLGGTFHSLHVGHKRYIETALRLAEHVTICVTTDRYARRLKQYEVAEYRQRFDAVQALLAELGALERCQLRQLDGDEDLEAFILSINLHLAVVEPAYFASFSRLNALRRQQGLPEFYILLKPRTEVDGRMPSSQNGD